MLHVVLHQPEIPPNTGNIIRLCANAGAQLHLIHPLGFSLDEKALRRAGLDYAEWVSVKEYVDYDSFLKTAKPQRLFACSTKATTQYDNAVYQQGDFLLFGAETRGLPAEILDGFPSQQKVKIPMRSYSRSLNLSNAVAIILFEAWRQLSFC